MCACVYVDDHRRSIWQRVRKALSARESVCVECVLTLSLERVLSLVVRKALPIFSRVCLHVGFVAISIRLRGVCVCDSPWLSPSLSFSVCT
jgi:hypothetical protein